MANSTDIQYNINLKTSADNSGVDEVKSKIKTIAEEPVVITTEVKTSDDNAQGEAAKAAAEEAKTIREAEAEALRQNAEEARQIRAEETSERQQTARANKQISDQERREKKAASDESVKLILKEQATKRALAEASKQATSESSQEDIKAAELARKNLESLEGVRKKQTSQQLADGKQVEGGIADQGKALAWLGSTWTKVAAGMTAAMGVFGLIMQAINGIKALWDWWNKDAIEAEKKKQEELEKTKEQVQELRDMVIEMRQKEKNDSIIQANNERWENERKYIEARNAAIQRGIDLKMKERLTQAHIEGNNLEIQKIELAGKFNEGLITELEYTEQLVALNEQQATLQDNITLAAAKDAEDKAKQQNIVASGHYETASNNYNERKQARDTLAINTPEKLGTAQAELTSFPQKLVDFEEKWKEKIDRMNKVLDRVGITEATKKENSALFAKKREEYNSIIEQQRTLEDNVEQYQKVLSGEVGSGSNDKEWIAKANEAKAKMNELKKAAEEAAEKLAETEKQWADAQTERLATTQKVESDKQLRSTQGAAETNKVVVRKEKEEAAKQAAKAKEEMKKNNDAQMAQYAANIVAGIEAAKTGKSAASTEARTKQLGDTSNIESKIAAALKDILGGGDKSIDKQEAQQLDALLSELQASSAFNTVLGRDIMAVINTNLESSIKLQLAEDKTRTDLAAIVAKTNKLYTIVKNIRG